MKQVKNNTFLKRIISNKSNLIKIAMLFLIVMVITASRAWYVLERGGNIRLFKDDFSNISEWKFKVYTDEQCTKLLENENDLFTNSITSSRYEKVDENNNNEKSPMKMLVPGVEGQFDLYVVSSDDVSTDYDLYINKDNLSIVDIVQDENGNSVEQINETYSKILQRHIVFYSEKTENPSSVAQGQDDDDIVRAAYSGEINKEVPMKGTVLYGKATQQKPLKITVYWLWQYDGQFLVDQFNSGNWPTEMANIYGSDGSTILAKYDEEDEILNQYKRNIRGYIGIDVKAIEQKPATSTPNP